uniref:Uncharacterized protein n=1 Tax=Alexandrium monilatum TaxID=311494 RepID=A0A7S4Q9A9_9DINO
MDPRTVQEVLSEARPSWTARDLAAVNAKLEHVGVYTTAHLREALDEHLRSHINFRFHQHGFKAFTIETLHALKLALGGTRRWCSEGELPDGVRPPALPKRPPKKLEIVPVLAQSCHVDIAGERMISQGTAKGWGVATFDAPADFVLTVQFTADAGPLAEPWINYVSVGLVPMYVHATQLAAWDQPWDAGLWVAPGTSPVQIWTRMRTPLNPISVPALPQSLQAGQTLYLKRDGHGMVGISVDEGAGIRIPWFGLERMRPCVLLGMDVEVKVWITLFSAAHRSPEGAGETSGQSPHGAAEEAPLEEPAAQDAAAQQAEAMHGAGGNAVGPEDREEVGDGALEREEGGDPSGDSDSSSDSGQLESPYSPKQERFVEIQKARRSKKYSVGDLVRLFDKTPAR